MITISISDLRLSELRELRLWHFEQAMQARTEAKQSEHIAPAYYQLRSEAANRHIKFVQALNDFFSVGDNAEHDFARKIANSEPR